MRLSLIKYRCNQSGCWQTASVARTYVLEGRHFVDDPACLEHAGESFPSALEGDWRPIAFTDPDLRTLISYRRILDFQVIGEVWFG